MFSIIERHSLRIVQGLLLGGLFLACGVTSLLPASAQYVVSPPRVFIKEKKDKNFGTASIRITNPSNETLRLKAYVDNWEMDEAGKISLTESGDPNGLAAYTSVSPKEFEVSPNGTQILRIAIALPTGKEAGEYHSMLYLENLKTDLQQQEIRDGVTLGVTLRYRSGVGLYYSKGAIRPDVQVKQFSFSQNPEGQPILHLALSNAGSHHARIQAMILLSRLVDEASHKMQLVKSIPLEEGGEILILPATSRVFEQALNTEKEPLLLEPGHYSAELNIKTSSSVFPQISKEFAVEVPATVQEFDVGLPAQALQK